MGGLRAPGASTDAHPAFEGVLEGGGVTIAEQVGDGIDALAFSQQFAGTAAALILQQLTKAGAGLG